LFYLIYLFQKKKKKKFKPLRAPLEIQAFEKFNNFPFTDREVLSFEEEKRV